MMTENHHTATEKEWFSIFLFLFFIFLFVFLFSFFCRIQSLSVTFVLTKVILNVNFTKYFSLSLQDRHFTKHCDFKTHLFTFGNKF